MAVNELHNALTPEVVESLEQGSKRLELRVREGRFQRWLALAAGLSSALSGLEVTYMHYRGSYNRRVMYTPVILSTGLLGAGIWAFRSRRAAITILPAVSAVTLLDSAVGFYFHLRGIQRKPGGWRLPIVNIAMGPPIFAPLLFGTSAYLGLLASFLQRDSGNVHKRNVHKRGLSAAIVVSHLPHILTPQNNAVDLSDNLRKGRFQKHVAVATALSAFFSGIEACYSHYKSNFRYKAQWTPVLLAPLLMTAGLGAVKSQRIARTWLPALSAVAMADGAMGFGYHARGIIRRPGGIKMPLYNIIHGPPIFAPLLFAAAGFIGLLASFLGRER